MNGAAGDRNSVGCLRHRVADARGSDGGTSLKTYSY